MVNTAACSQTKGQSTVSALPLPACHTCITIWGSVQNSHSSSQWPLLEVINSKIMSTRVNYSGHLTYRTSVARLVKSSASCTDDDYYQYSDPYTLLHLYLSLVWPHTEYAAQVWDLHLLKDITFLENVHKFVLCVCCKNWNMGYSELLDLCSVPSLENRRLHLKLCHMFKIVNNLCYFPPEIVVQSPSLLHSSRPPLLHQLFSRTTALANSFLPDTIRKWNCPPTELVNAPTLHSFRASLCVFTCN